MFRVATDLDGSLCEGTIVRSRYDLNRYYRTCVPKRKGTLAYGVTNGNLLIITSRKERFRPLTEQWLKEHGIVHQHLFMMPEHISKSRRNIIKWKANLLKELRISMYFEDDPLIVKKLQRILGTNVKIVLIGGEKVE